MLIHLQTSSIHIKLHLLHLIHTVRGAICNRLYHDVDDYIH